MELCGVQPARCELPNGERDHPPSGEHDRQPALGLYDCGGALVKTRHATVPRFWLGKAALHERDNPERSDQRFTVECIVVPADTQQNLVADSGRCGLFDGHWIVNAYECGLAACAYSSCSSMVPSAGETTTNVVAHIQ